MTTDTNMGTPIIDATTIRVTPRDRSAAAAKADAVEDRLASTYGDIATLSEEIDLHRKGCTVTVVERYLAMGPMVVRAMGYGESQRAIAKATGVAQARLSRAKSMFESWPVDESPSELFPTYAETLRGDAKATVEGFVRFVIGGPNKTQTPEQRLASAVRSCLKAGMSSDDIRVIVEATLAP